MVEPSFAQSQIRLIEDLLSGKELQAFDKAAFQPRFAVIGAGISGSSIISAAASQSGNRFDDAPNGSVAIIPLKGTLLKEDQFCGPVGTETISSWIRQARLSENIIGAIMVTDSPGGQVDGTSTLSQEIEDFAKEKPIKAFISSGMAASAAYWAISGSTEIVSSSKTDSIGSIGVFVQIMDVEKYMKEKEGISIRSIYSSRSSEKNLPVREALDGKDELLITEILDPIADEFIANVEKNRGEKLNYKAGDPMKGALFMAEKALKVGLIDSIATLDEVINSFAAGNPSSKSTKPKAKDEMKKISFSATLAALAAILGLKPEAGQETLEFDATEENLAKLNSIAAQNAQLSQELETVKATVTERDSTIATVTKALADLQNQPGAGSNSPIKKAADKIDEPEPEEGLSSVDLEARELAKNSIK